MKKFFLIWFLIFCVSGFSMLGMHHLDGGLRGAGVFAFFSFVIAYIAALMIVYHYLGAFDAIDRVKRRLEKEIAEKEKVQEQWAEETIRLKEQIRLMKQR